MSRPVTIGLFELSYNEIKGDEAGWPIESRCAICPDALGAASVAGISACRLSTTRFQTPRL